MTLSILLTLLLMPGLAAAEGGIVAGTVRGADGRPAAKVRVGVMAVPEAGRVVFGAGTLVSQGETDASGEFQIEEVPPGRYYIVAGSLQVPTFYPGVGEMKTAKTIQVVAKASVRGLDFQLFAMPPYRVVALVSEDTSDRPLAGERVELVSAAGEVQQQVVNAQGSVTFPGLFAGTYVLRLVPGGFEVPQKQIVITDNSAQVQLRARKKP